MGGLTEHCGDNETTLMSWVKKVVENDRDSLRAKKQSELREDSSFKAVFQDEVHFQGKTSITSIWAEKGAEPKQMSKPGKWSIAYSDYLIPETCLQ